MAMKRTSIYTLCVLFMSFIFAESSPRQLNTESILINVTAGTLNDTQVQESNNLQINLNISVDEEQVFINDIPVELSGVTRLNCQALLLDTTNGTSEFESGDYVSTVTRVMVSQNRLWSDSEEVVALQVFSEVIEMEGKKVQQPEMCEVKILMSPNFQTLAQYTNTYPIGHSEIFRIPRENDVVITDPTNQKKSEYQVMSQTTSHYPLKHADTTQEETAAPGKLPETPLRMEPDLLYDNNDERDDLGGLLDQMQTEAPLKESISSYSAMCRWVEEVRDRLRRFWSESLPLFFLVMWVVVIGVVGSAVIVKILDMFFPTCEHKGIFHLNPVTLMPEDEKHTLLENIEIEVEEVKRPSMKTEEESDCIC
ncbi:glycoprotein integral membrane protein 1-like [Salvelinus namaycush]|uniref:Glycoprotein integral membrane protein 1-like n=1 Tax=Salvelinus namaycush TaxID=8040 RepID=A0A8U0PJ10_SALNM|nr:glycoprotein integral membrane protein 1-like [Salvelinus namaycush]